MSDFCKVFNDELVGQILVINDQSDDGRPSVAIKFTPKGLGVCGTEFKFADNDSGCDECVVCYLFRLRKCGTGESSHYLCDHC